MKQAQVGLVVGIPSRGAVAIDWFAHMQEVLGWMPPGLKWQLYYVKGKKVVEARQDIVDYALGVNAKHLLFIDDDTYAPMNAILRLWNARKPVISGVYYDKNDPCMPMVFKEDGAGPWIEVISKPKTLYPIASAGLGMTMISREVLLAIKRPHFKWVDEEEGDGSSVRLGEDTYFYKQVRDAGFQSWVDTQVMCLHGENTITPDSHCEIKFYPSKEQAAEYLEMQKPSLA